jgi:hypothetical protein
MILKDLRSEKVEAYFGKMERGWELGERPGWSD